MNHMPELPVNKWNLLFHSEDLEIQYQKSQMTFQLLFHKTMMICGTIVCLICLIVFVAQSQPLLIILQMVASLVGIFSQLLLSNFLIRYTQKVYAINYLSCIVVGQYISQTGTNVQSFNIISPQYILGHTYCIILICCLRLCHNKIKGFLLIATPVAILIIQGAIRWDNIYLILYLIEGTICLAFVIYLIEYQARKAFFISFTAAQYVQAYFLISYLLQEFTNDGLFALSLNDRTQQFNLEFHNNNMIKYCKIQDENQRKNFLRNSFIVDLQISDAQVRKNAVNRLNLEDYLFQKIKGEFDVLFECKKIINEEDNKNRIFQITLKMLNIDKKMIFISLQNNQFSDLINQQKQLKNNYQAVIVNQSLQLSRLQQKFSEQFNKIQVDERQKKQLFSLKCINLQIRNILNNYLVFFQQDKMLKVIQDAKSCRFNDFISSMENFFINYSSSNQRQFKLINQLPNYFSLNINYNVLAQILINVFEDTLNQSIVETTINLIINITNHLNPLKITKKGGQDYFTGQEESLQSIASNNQFLIHFSFSFEGLDQEIEADQQFELEFTNFTLEQIKNFNLAAAVTNILVGKIGPYKSIISKKDCHFENISQYLTKHFYIYADLTQIDQSCNFKSANLACF